MEVATVLLSILIMATIVQFLVDVVKNAIPIIQIGPVKLTPLYAIAIGIALAVVFKIDMFAQLGFKTDQVMIAQVFTGLAISAGSGPVHELVSKLRESRSSVQLENMIDYEYFDDDDDEDGEGGD